ncbi:unnamed protein product [Amoebophrya sp. A25]|nr:unnamed protein product [Amoebophrya sp. A25]|eukprot:GSA25T00004418001.1
MDHGAVLSAMLAEDESSIEEESAQQSPTNGDRTLPDNQISAAVLDTTSASDLLSTQPPLGTTLAPGQATVISTSSETAPQPTQDLPISEGDRREEKAGENAASSTRKPSAEGEAFSATEPEKICEPVPTWCCPLNEVVWTHTCLPPGETAQFASQIVCASPLCQSVGSRTGRDIRHGIVSVSVAVPGRASSSASAGGGQTGEGESGRKKDEMEIAEGRDEDASEDSSSPSDLRFEQEHQSADAGILGALGLPTDEDDDLMDDVEAQVGRYDAVSNVDVLKTRNKDHAELDETAGMPTTSGAGKDGASGGAEGNALGIAELQGNMQRDFGYLLRKKVKDTETEKKVREKAESTPAPRTTEEVGNSAPPEDNAAKISSATSADEKDDVDMNKNGEDGEKETVDPRPAGMNNGEDGEEETVDPRPDGHPALSFWRIGDECLYHWPKEAECSSSGYGCNGVFTDAPHVLELLENCGDADTVQLLGNLHRVRPFDVHDVMLLLSCRSVRNVPLVPLLLEKVKANVNYQDRNGRTCLYQAVVRCGTEPDAEELCFSLAKKSLRDQQHERAAARDLAEKKAAKRAMSPHGADKFRFRGNTSGDRRRRWKKRRHDHETESTLNNPRSSTITSKIADQTSQEKQNVNASGPRLALQHQEVEQVKAIDPDESSSTSQEESEKALAKRQNDALHHSKTRNFGGSPALHATGSTSPGGGTNSAGATLSTIGGGLASSQKLDETTTRLKGEPVEADNNFSISMKTDNGENEEGIASATPGQQRETEDQKSSSAATKEVVKTTTPAVQDDDDEFDSFLDVVALLLRFGARANHPVRPSLLDCRSIRCARMLLDYGANVCIQRPPDEINRGDSVLHAAVLRADRAMIYLLLKEAQQTQQLQALTGLKDQFGHSAVSACKDEICAYMLLSAGCAVIEDWVVPLNKDGDHGHPCERVRIQAKIAFRYITPREAEYQVKMWRQDNPEWRKWKIKT